MLRTTFQQRIKIFSFWRGPSKLKWTVTGSNYANGGLIYRMHKPFHYMLNLTWADRFFLFVREEKGLVLCDSNDLITTLSITRIKYINDLRLCAPVLKRTFVAYTGIRAHWEGR